MGSNDYSGKGRATGTALISPSVACWYDSGMCPRVPQTRGSDPRRGAPAKAEGQKDQRAPSETVSRIQPWWRPWLWWDDSVLSTEWVAFTNRSPGKPSSRLSLLLLLLTNITQEIEGLVSVICCCSVTKLCPTLYDPMDCTTPGFPLLLYLLKFAQIYVHWVGDAI